MLDTWRPRGGEVCSKCLRTHVCGLYPRPSGRSLCCFISARLDSDVELMYLILTVYGGVLGSKLTF